MHPHLQSGEHSRFALAHLQIERVSLQEHFASSLHAMETSGIVIHTGSREPCVLLQAKFCGDGTSSRACVLLIQIPAW